MLVKECLQDKVIIPKIGILIMMQSLENEQSKINLKITTTNLQDQINDLIQKIESLTAFECDDLDLLKDAISQFQKIKYGYSVEAVTSCIDMWNRDIKPFYKGSWNCPLFIVKDVYRDEERTYYKVLRKTNDTSTDLVYQYEFHKDFVPINKWIQAEISSSDGLSGLIPKTEGGCGGRFHLLLDYLQAKTYLSKRTDDTWFPKEIAEIVQVRARKFQTIDLIYVPPTTFVWGIDSEEMYLKYESVTI